jgi:hypothetical protein
MAYTLTYSGGTIIVDDNTLNTDTSLQLPGKYFSGYGTYVDQNFVTLTQNFAGPANPSNAIRGQLWFDTVNNKLKYNISTTKGSPNWIEIPATGANSSVSFSNLNVGTLTTNNITTGAAVNPGTITGTWALTTGSSIQIQKATTSVLGTVRVDGTSIKVNGSGVISQGIATTSQIGGVRPDGTTIFVSNTGVISTSVYSLPTANTTTLGGVKIDGSTITINGSGVISVPIATTSSLGVVYVNPNPASPLVIDGSGMLNISVATSAIAGVVRPDNTTITVDGTGIVSVPKASTTTAGVVRIRDDEASTAFFINAVTGLLGIYPVTAGGYGVARTQSGTGIGAYTASGPLAAGTLVLSSSGSGTVLVPNNGTSPTITHNLGRVPVIVVSPSSGSAVVAAVTTNVTANTFTIFNVSGGDGNVDYWYW